MTNQEMFDKAWAGLRAQEWQLALGKSGGCVYLSPEGKRCAWGHVDPEGTAQAGCYNGSGVGSLRRMGIGLAAHLSGPELKFAEELQNAHDGTNADPNALHGSGGMTDGNGQWHTSMNTPPDMEGRLRHLAKLWGLTVPE